MLIDTEIAWLAGFVDGDGSIKIQRQVYKGKEYFYPRFAVTNNSLEVLERVKELLSEIGVEVGVRDKSRKPIPESKRKNWRVTRDIQLSGYPAVEVIRLVLPFLIHPEKKEIGKYILEKWGG